MASWLRYLTSVGLGLTTANHSLSAFQHISPSLRVGLTPRCALLFALPHSAGPVLCTHLSIPHLYYVLIPPYRHLLPSHHPPQITALWLCGLNIFSNSVFLLFPTTSRVRFSMFQPRNTSDFGCTQLVFTVLAAAFFSYICHHRSSVHLCCLPCTRVIPSTYAHLCAVYLLLCAVHLLLCT